MAAIAELIERINQIHWREQSEVTAEAMALIDCHIQRIRPIVQDIVSKTGKPVSEAHGIALVPAHDNPEADKILETIWDEGNYSVAREPVILTIAASETWHLDPEFSGFPNPWRPLVELICLGYPTSYVDAPDMSSVHLCVGLRDGTQEFPVCGGPEDGNGISVQSGSNMDVTTH